MNSRICDSVQDIRFRGAGMASPFTIVPMRTIVLAVLNLCISAAAFAQPGTCAGLSPGPLASLNGFVPFPSSNLWNTEHLEGAGGPQLREPDRLHRRQRDTAPDFGAGLYAGQTMGIPYQIEAGIQAKVPVKLTEYPGNSDPGPMPIPANALIAGYPKPGNGDRHVLVLDQGSCWLYELYYAGIKNGAWYAGSSAIWDSESLLRKGHGEAHGMVYGARGHFVITHQPDEDGQAAGVALGAHHHRRECAAHGHADAAEGQLRYLWLFVCQSGDPDGAQEVRHDSGRQWQRHLHHRHARQSLEQQ